MALKTSCREVHSGKSGEQGARQGGAGHVGKGLSCSARCQAGPASWVVLGAELRQQGLAPSPEGGRICLLSTGSGRAEPPRARCPPAALLQGLPARRKATSLGASRGLDTAFQLRGVLGVRVQPAQ